MTQNTTPPPGDGEPPFELQYFAPDPDLAEMVSSFYVARINIPHFDAYERADRPQFRVMSNPDGEYTFAAGHVVQASRATNIGTTTGDGRSLHRAPPPPARTSVA